VKYQFAAVITEDDAGDAAGAKERSVQDNRSGGSHPGYFRMEKPKSKCNGSEQH
jgi:hypothetical protein